MIAGCRRAFDRWSQAQARAVTSRCGARTAGLCGAARRRADGVVEHRPPPGRVQHAFLDHDAGAIPALLARLTVVEPASNAFTLACLLRGASRRGSGRRAYLGFPCCQQATGLAGFSGRMNARRRRLPPPVVCGPVVPAGRTDGACRDPPFLAATPVRSGDAGDRGVKPVSETFGRSDVRPSTGSLQRAHRTSGSAQRCRGTIACRRRIGRTPPVTSACGSRLRVRSRCAHESNFPPLLGHEVASDRVTWPRVAARCERARQDMVGGLLQDSRTGQRSDRPPRTCGGGPRRPAVEG
jgi:hypothetical protein